MSQHATKLLKNLNGSFLFFFLVIFTAPLDADEVISGNLGDERRRAHADPVVVNIISHDAMSPTRTNAATETAPEDRISIGDATTDYSSQEIIYSDVASADRHLQQAFWCHQSGNELLQTELDQRSSDKTFSKESELQSESTQWIGTVISETGPPSFPENSTSYLAGHENNGRLPQVAIINTPDIVTQKVFYRIDRKILSVRTPTGPPNSQENNISTRSHQSGSTSSPSTASLNLSIRIPTYSSGMQAMLQGTPVLMST